MYIHFFYRKRKKKARILNTHFQKLNSFLYKKNRYNFYIAGEKKMRKIID